MSEKRHHTKLKREELALLRRYDLDELAFQTGVSKTTLWSALHGRELRQKTREKIVAWTAKEHARDLKALKGSHLDVWRSRDGRCVRFLLVITALDAKRAGFDANTRLNSITGMGWYRTKDGSGLAPAKWTKYRLEYHTRRVMPGFERLRPGQGAIFPMRVAQDGVTMILEDEKPAKEENHE